MAIQMRGGSTSTRSPAGQRHRLWTSDPWEMTMKGCSIRPCLGGGGGGGGGQRGTKQDDHCFCWWTGLRSGLKTAV